MWLLSKFKALLSDMASTSTSEQIFQYDVFLNHRGKDTKKQFLVPLVEKLRDNGIERPFLDQQGIDHGELVSQVIDEALKSARMHIAVFSSSYAESRHCLSELQEMLQTGRDIIPVFYDVKPEHVRRPRDPKGPFEEAFQKHLERQKPQVVEGWVAAMEKAMEKAADRYGFERDSPKYRGDDELLMKDIVDKIVRLLCPGTVTIPRRGGQYNWISHYKLPTKGQGIILFAADTYKNLHIAFSAESGMAFPSYEIVIGSQDSSKHTRSEIRRLMRSERTVCSYSPMDLTDTFPEGNWHHFWICIDQVKKLIYVGRGQDLEEKHVFLIFKDPSFVENIQYLAFTTDEVPITYTGIRVEEINEMLIGSFGQDSLTNFWGSIDASHVPPPSGNVNFSKSAHNYGDYDWSKTYKLPTPGQGIVSFSVKTVTDVKAVTDVRVAISPEPQTMDSMYKMVIGGWDNNESGIQKKEILCCVPTMGWIQRKNENRFWVSINVETQLIHVGQGNQPSLASVICIYKDPDFVSEACYVSFFSLDEDVIYSNIFVASPSGTRLLSTRTLELPPSTRNYNWNSSYRLSSKGQGILYFAAKAKNDIHVAISPKCATMNPMYEIVIGGWGNTKSCIRRCSQGELLHSIDIGSIDVEGLNHYWVSIDKDTKLIQVGQRKQDNLDSIILECIDQRFLRNVMYIAFSTGDTPISYSSIVVAFPSVIITRPIQWPNPHLQDPHLKLVISENRLGHYEWEPYFELPCKGQGVVTFAAETTTDIHVAISPEPETMEPMYEIVIGGWNNSKSVIRRASQTDKLCSLRGSPIARGLNYYWVSIDASTQLIQIGLGRNPGTSILFSGRDEHFISDAHYVSFTNLDKPMTYSNISLGNI